MCLINIILGQVLQYTSSSSEEAEEDRFLWVWGHSGLYSEARAIKDYTSKTVIFRNLLVVINIL